MLKESFGLAWTIGKMAMKDRENPRYCSSRCEETLIVRSFRDCTLCGLIWNGLPGGPNYCNGVWKVCVDCASIESRCVVCGERTPDAPRDMS
jgi:hypothetical protein